MDLVYGRDGRGVKKIPFAIIEDVLSVIGGIYYSSEQVLYGVEADDAF